MINLRFLRVGFVVAGVALALPVGATQQGVPAGGKVVAPVARREPLGSLLKRIGSSAKVTLLCESYLNLRPVHIPAEVPQDEASVVAFVRSIKSELPANVSLVKVYLPAPAPDPASSVNLRLSGDSVAQFVQVQRQMYGLGAVTAYTGDTAFKFMGQTVPANQAEALTATLHLRPVFLLMSLGTHPRLREGQRWNEMTADEQKAYTDEISDDLLGMPVSEAAANLLAMVDPSQKIMMALVQKMSPDAQKELRVALDQIINKGPSPQTPRR